ncbi:Lactamase-like protein vrtG [Fusarium oxysporum f. sp. albedinis]|nr:Lactamase-like protein vrtG [Fusarium oxysporum f. sp. albedinis]
MVASTVQQMPCPEHGRRETEDDGPRRRGKNERAFCLGSLYPQDRMAPFFCKIIRVYELAARQSVSQSVSRSVIYIDDEFCSVRNYDSNNHTDFLPMAE